MIRWAAVVLSLVAVVGCDNDEQPEDSRTFTPPTEPTAPEASPTEVAPTPAPEASPTPAPTEPSEETYTVEPGDTLSGIAQRFGTSVERLVEANDLEDPDLIRAGDDLVVPAAGTQDR